MGDLFWPFELSAVTEWPGSSAGRNAVHMGTDFGIPQGTELRATVSGSIIRHNNDGLGAYVLDIVRADGLLVRNAHLSRMDVNTGDQVTAGQVIGLTGGTPGTPGAGNTSGAHLHWELRWDRLWQGGTWFDPRTAIIGNLSELNAPTTDTREAEMFVKVNLETGAAFLWNMLTGAINHIAETPDYTQIDNNFKTLKFADDAAFAAFRGRFGVAFAPPATNVDVPAISASVVAALGNVDIDVEALADAIAKRLGTGGDVPVTKAEILTAIEDHYTGA